MKTQRIVVPDVCPECGTAVFLVWGRRGQPSVLRCMGAYDADPCAWRLDVEVDADADEYLIVAVHAPCICCEADRGVRVYRSDLVAVYRRSRGEQ